MTKSFTKEYHATFHLVNTRLIAAGVSRADHGDVSEHELVRLAANAQRTEGLVAALEAAERARSF